MPHRRTFAPVCGASIRTHGAVSVYRNASHAGTLRGFAEASHKVEVAGASHAVYVSRPKEVAALIGEAEKLPRMITTKPLR